MQKGLSRGKNLAVKEKENVILLPWSLKMRAPQTVLSFHWLPSILPSGQEVQESSLLH